MVSELPKESVKGENALYVFNRLLRMAAETELSTWKQNQVRNFLKHDQIDEILSLTDGFGRTILDIACSAGNLRLVQHLWPMGAKLGKPHVTMSIICSDEHLPVLDYLLSHDSKLSTTEVVVGDEEDGVDRMPLLNLCAKKGDERPFSVLLAYGFKTAKSVSASLDRAGNTPLHVVRTEKIAAQLLKRAGLDVLGKSNLRGQFPIDCLLERYRAIPSLSRFGLPVGYEEELKKTINFLNTLMNHVPRRHSNLPKRTVTPPTLPRVSSLTGSMGAPSMLHKQSSGPSSPIRVPPKPFLSRDMMSKVAVRNRVALLQEQREHLKTQVAALHRHRMIDMHAQEPSIKQQRHLLALKQQTTNPLAIMEAAIQNSQSSPSRTGALHLPLTPGNASPVNTNSHKRYVAAIEAAFASEHNTPGGMNSSLSILASALSTHSKNKNLMLQEDLRMRVAANKCLVSKPGLQNSEVHKLLRTKYC